MLHRSVTDRTAAYPVGAVRSSLCTKEDSSLSSAELIFVCQLSLSGELLIQGKMRGIFYRKKEDFLET
jgi:hypothetical protein